MEKLNDILPLFYLRIDIKFLKLLKPKQLLPPISTDQTTTTQMETASRPQYYQIPLKYRVMENMHIAFWLLKDIGWCLFWKPLGIIMIFPTLIISLLIAWRTRNLMSELCHNLAITFWICANSYWMIVEYIGIDTDLAIGSVAYKHLALIPFGLGVLALLFYYAWWHPRHRGEIETL
jgi:hypothetical protein